MKQANYLGPAGENATKAEFLRRGYNVAAPELDEGIDLFLYDSSSEFFAYAQVKSSKAEPVRDGAEMGHYLLSRKQLQRVQRTQLFYVFVLERPTSFEFVVLPRKELHEIRVVFENTAPKEARTDDLNLRLFFEKNGEVFGWGRSFSLYRGLERFFPRKVSPAR